ncbi:MAG TPA: choice-of-anchor D domain-containing protein [Blastocatellia bacterium]|nr:choice-of-anchor D domain-containing protein [Blastocatellia bacterium]
MKSSHSPARHSAWLRYSILSTVVALILIDLIAANSFVMTGASKAYPGSPGQSPLAGESCSNATAINPASLPFTEDTTAAGAGNDIDPGLGGCAPGAGPDVAYSFTPSATDTYTVGVTPAGPGFDLSLYIVTDCSNPAGACVAGANVRGIGKGEQLSVTLNAGTQYFIVVDTPSANATPGAFHFALRRGTPANDNCAGASVIEPNRLPFTTSGTTFGASNDFNPGTPCLRSNQSATGRDVVYQFTSADSQNYDLTVTPIGNFDVTVYIVTSCPGLGGCSSADVGGDGETETLRRNLTAGTTYFIIVDGFQADAGDFTLSLVPTIPLAPPAPSDLVATVVSATRVDLTWTDNSNNELGFRVLRSLDNITYTEIATLPPNTTSFSDTTVTPNTTFFYRVVAFNNFGNSEPSNTVGVTTPDVEPPPVPVINVSPTTVDFGTVNVTLSATRTVTITNAGGVPLTITAISDPTGPFSIVNRPQLPVTIPAGESIQITVRFTPVSTGAAQGSFTISSNDPARPVVTVNLQGQGAAAPVPDLQVSRLLVEFPAGSGNTTFEIRNSGNADLLIASVFLPAAPFTVSGLGAPVTLGPNQSINVTVTFAPTTQGVFTSQLSIVSNDPDVQVLAVRFRGVETAPSPRVAGLEFRKKALRFTAANSNVVAGAVLIVDNTETFQLQRNGDFWVVTKNARSTPGNRRVRDIFRVGQTHTVVVRNPDGRVSSPVTLSR